MPEQKTIFITGIAGFIGFHLAKRMLKEGYRVIGLDNLNDYYDPQLKLDRLAELGLPIAWEDLEENEIFDTSDEQLTFCYGSLEDSEGMESIFATYQPDLVCHLAAQAGVRYSLDNPQAYIQSNLLGFANILENCRNYRPEHLVYASSSSVYGLNENVPFRVGDNVDHPVSLYAATKKANELMAHSYSHLYNIPTTGLRFFTVYGPWGRPDMAYMKFANIISEGGTIQVYNEGNLSRDFTYIDDIIEGIYRLLQKTATSNPEWTGKSPDPSSSPAPYRVYNIGNGQPVNLLEFIEILEKELGQKANKEYVPMQPGDVYQTWAEGDALAEAIGFRPSTSLREGLKAFVAWYVGYRSEEAGGRR
jgi:UDP-glucuronate 4-epimerase